MWIFTKKAFVSIVEDHFDPNVLLVRARLEGDLERFWPDAEVEVTPDHDYRYRARLGRQAVAAVIAREVLDIDYPNYKASLEDHRRSIWYLRVWSAMAEMQEALKVVKRAVRRRGK